MGRGCVFARNGSLATTGGWGMNGTSAATAGRILLVEDDPITARFTMHVLGKRGGFDVTHAPEPATALELAKAEAWDLVLTDVEMPGMTGIELLEELRKISPELPVAVVTAHPSVDRAVRALRSRADEFLEKPVKPDYLIAIASELVSKGRAARLAGHRSVLAIGAHPDDVEIGAGGALLAHRSMGDTVSILTMCRGARGGSQATRAGESQRAAEILGVRLFLNDLADTQISEGNPTIGVISEVISEVAPAVIYTHSLHDVHQDHRNTHQAAMVAARGIGRVYCFQSPSATVDFRPTRFVPIDDHLERKLAAIDAFASQVEIRGYLEPDLIASTARYWSRFGEGRYAEAFEVIREAADITGQGARRAMPVAAPARPPSDEPARVRDAASPVEVTRAVP
jgi:LmbE family N-acetylglucosaminyl deacetylase/ActR/RegA family two-component response regulator